MGQSMTCGLLTRPICPDLMQEYWDSKPVTETFHAAICVAYRVTDAHLH